MCEDPRIGYTTSGEQITDNRSFAAQSIAEVDLIPAVPAVDPIPFTPSIDLRGIWKHPGKPALDAKEPEDLVAYGIRVPQHAVLATWGEGGLVRYNAAVAEDEQPPLI